MSYLLLDGGSPIATLMFPIAMIAVLYFFMIRPQQQARKKQTEFSSGVERGKHVVTIGGMHGTIVETTATTVTLLVAEKTKIKFQREAISMESTNAAYPNQIIEKTSDAA